MGHTSIAHAATVSADSRYALSGGTDPYIILWDLEMCTEIRRLFLPTSAVVKTLAFSPDSKLALSGLSDGVVILWDVATGEPLARYDGHYGEIAQARFSPSGKTFFSTALDGTLREWTLPPRSAEDWLNWSFANRYVRELASAEQQFYKLPTSRSRSAPRSGGRTAAQVAEGVSSVPIGVPTTPSLTLVMLDGGIAHLGENRGVIPPGGGQRWTLQGRKGQLVTINVIADQPTTGIYSLAEQIAGALIPGCVRHL
jgi:hypothetical protein